MIRDRGNIKWTAMMLPEHIVELRNWMDKDHYIERPELSEWDLQSIQEEIEVSTNRKCQTLVKTWIPGLMQGHFIVIVVLMILLNSGETE